MANVCQRRNIPILVLFTALVALIPAGCSAIVLFARWGKCDQHFRAWLVGAGIVLVVDCFVGVIFWLRYRKWMIDIRVQPGKLEFKVLRK